MAVNISVTSTHSKLTQKIPVCVKDNNPVAVLTSEWAGGPRNLGSVTGRSNKDSLCSPKTSKLPGANSDTVSSEIRWPEH